MHDDNDENPSILTPEDIDALRDAAPEPVFRRALDEAVEECRRRRRLPR